MDAATNKLRGTNDDRADDDSQDISLLSSANPGCGSTEDMFLEDLSVDKSSNSSSSSSGGGGNGTSCGIRSSPTSVSPTNSNDLSSRTDTTSSSYFIGSDKNDASKTATSESDDDDDDSNF